MPAHEPSCPDCNRPYRVHRRKRESDGEYWAVRVDEPFLSCDGRLLREGVSPLSAHTETIGFSAGEDHYERRLSKDYIICGALGELRDDQGK